MTEAEWLGCTDKKPLPMFFLGQASNRKMSFGVLTCSALVFILGTGCNHRVEPPSAKRPTMTDASADKLLEQRVILIDGPIEDKGATEVIARLLYLNHLDNKAPVRILVNSPGGSLAAGMAILDTMDDIGPPVFTCCTGNASGMALAVVAHGAKGHRTASAEAKFLLTPIWSLEAGDKVDQQLEKDRQVFIGLLVKDTKRKAAEVQTDMENARSLNAAEARAYGIIDSLEQK